jgi:archaemetzincin
LGEFSPAERKVVKITSDFLNACYQLPVKTSEDLSLSLIPNSARRTRNEKLQIQSTYVLDQVLKPRLPNDAVASIAFTSTDLWPGEGWNFVFGQASLEERVGVWSIHRFGNAQGSDAAAVKQMLRRTLKTAVHETGHMFSMQHCVYYACVMNGSNHLEEADRQPLWFCPECSAKLCYATGAEPKLQYEQLVQFAEKNQFEAERELWVRSLQLFKEK